MKNPLHEELEELRYISISSIDPYDIPESVVIYFKNNSEVNKKMSIETIHGTQLDLQNQNPTIVLENYKATFCLGGSGYVPVVTIDYVEDILDPEYPRQITFTGTVSRTDNYIPNAILVEYEGVSARAFLTDDTHWSVTFSLSEVTKNTLQRVSVVANSLDINNSENEGEYSLPVSTSFSILFTEDETVLPEPEPLVDLINCICIDLSKDYKVTVEEEVFSGPFLECVEFLEQKGIYAYPSQRFCAPCDNPIPYLLFPNNDPSGPYDSSSQKHSLDLYINDVFIKTIKFNKNIKGTYALVETLRQIPGVAIRSLAPNAPDIYTTKLSVHNVTEDYLQIRLEANEKVMKEFKNVEYDPDTPATIELPEDDYIISFCLEPSPPLVCEDSVDSFVSLNNNLYFAFNPDIRVNINGVDFKADDFLSLSSKNFYMYISGYGLEFSNKTTDCLDVRIYIDTNNPDVNLLLATIKNTYGFVETYEDHIRLVLKGVEPAIPYINFEIRDEYGYNIGENVLNTTSTHTLYVNLSIDSGYSFLQDSFSASITINGEVYLLSNEDESSNLTLILDTPLSEGLESDPYILDVDIQADFEYVVNGLYEKYIKPFNRYKRPDVAGRISILEREGSEWTRLIGNSTHYDPNSRYDPEHMLLQTPREGTALLELDPIFVGLTLKFGDTSYTITNGIMTIPYKHNTYYDDGHPDNAANIYFYIENSAGDRVTDIVFPTIRHYISIYDFNVGISNIRSFLYLRQNSAYTFCVTGFDLAVTSVKLSWGNIGSRTPPDGSAFFDPNEIYPVQNGDITLPARVLTTIYYPAEYGRYIINYVVATIVDATNPELIGQKITTHYDIYWQVA